MNKALRVLSMVWFDIAVLINVAVIIGLFAGAGGFWAGLARLWSVYSPFSILNWITQALLFAPAIGAFYWLDKRLEQEQLKSIRRDAA